MNFKNYLIVIGVTLSHLVFAQNINVTSPNGGERIDSCSPFTISLIGRITCHHKVITITIRKHVNNWWWR